MITYTNLLLRVWHVISLQLAVVPVFNSSCQITHYKQVQFGKGILLVCYKCNGALPVKEASRNTHEFDRHERGGLT